MTRHQRAQVVELLRCAADRLLTPVVPDRLAYRDGKAPEQGGR